MLPREENWTRTFQELMILTIWLPIDGFCFRSEFSCSAAWRGLPTIIYKLVSSAKSLIEESISTTMSLMYRRNKSGPKIEPCGTPAPTDVQEELAPGSTTFGFLSFK